MSNRKYLITAALVAALAASASAQTISNGGTGKGSGTVTSVGITAPPEFSVSAPVTTNGNISITKASQSANTVWAAPNGSSGAPGFRALVGADLTGQLTSTEHLSLSPLTPIILFPGGGNEYGDHYISQTNAGGHATYSNSAFAVASSPVGSGLNGPAYADFGASISAIKQNYLTSTQLGEMDGLMVVTRQGYDDSDGILVDAGGVDGFIGVLEGGAHIFDTSGNIIKDIDIQLASIETGRTGTPGSSGMSITAKTGALGEGLIIQSEAGGSWSSAIQINAQGNPGTVVYSLDMAGQENLVKSTITPAGNSVGLVINAPSDSLGAAIQLSGNGSSNQTKYIRASGGSLQVVNNANSTVIWSLDDSGNLTLNGGVVGATTAAASGNQGETKSNFNASPVTMVSGTSITCASLSLTAGVWDISAVAQFSPAAGNFLTAINAGLSQTANTLPADAFATATLNATFATSGTQKINAPRQFITLASSGTIYLVGNASANGGSPTCEGEISAVRFH